MNILKAQIGYNVHGAYCIPDSEVIGHGSCTMKGGVHEPQTLRFISEHCGDGDIVSAGAFFGDFFPFLSKCVKGTIWSCEPVMESFRAAQITLLLNDIHNVNLRHCGVGSTTSEGVMQITGAGKEHVEGGMNGCLGGACRIIPEEIAGQETEKIVISKLDHMIPEDRKITVMQLDVEYHEEEALQGAMRIIEANKPPLILETVQVTAPGVHNVTNRVVESEFYQDVIFKQMGYQIAPFVGDLGETGRIHANIVLEHKDNPCHFKYEL